ncbi:MAG: SpoIIE family protein phosphatase [Deltaproteobacteria bacterium]|nr:SpoIIE family protein phosphatase [Deltaproteobacteria bacterium]
MSESNAAVKIDHPGIRRGKGIAFRFSAWILLSTTVIFGAVFGYYYAISRGLIVANVEQYARQLALGTANRIDRILGATEKIPENFSLFIAEPISGEKLVAHMLKILETNPDVYGSAVAFEPFAWDPKIRSYSPYLHKGKNGIVSTLIPYDYFSWDWYKTPKALNRPVWTEPYFDEGAGNIIMSTYSVPFYREPKEGQPRFTGIVTVDISLERLREIVSDIRIGQTGYAFLISQKGTFVTHPKGDWIMAETIFRIAETRKDPLLQKIGAEMTAGKSGFIQTDSLMDGRSCWLAYTPLTSNGWSLGLVFPRDELMADVSRHYRQALLLGAVGLIFLCGVIVWISRGITRPLRALTDSAEMMAGGNLDVPIPAGRTRDEVGRLAGAFSAMQGSLQAYIRDLTETTAAKERIESDLRVAHDIQMGILPRVFPPFPERSDLDIFATLKPAKEVGGDLYDFFFMDEDHLCFTVGDVSGKGVPASLLMAVTKILIKAKATQGLTSDAILARVNEDLSLDNPSMMFVTLFLGILDVRTGEVVYCNAGHNSPYVIPADGRILQIERTEGMAVGIMGDFVYHSKTIMLEKNDRLFLYTDGVTEAQNARCELFSEERLEKELARLRDRSLRELVTGTMEGIEAFVREAPQADDITMMVVHYRG